MNYRPLTQESALQTAKLRVKTYRDESGRALLEGERLLGEAIAQGVALHYVIVQRGREQRFADLLARSTAMGIPVYSTTEKRFLRFSDTKHPQGIAAVADIPRVNAVRTIATVPAHVPVIALHGIADPGNLGTIIRSMDWFACTLLLVSRGSVDAWNPKVIRAAMGSLFRVGIAWYEDEADLLALAGRAGRVLVAASARGGIPVSSFKPRENLLLVFGSEAHGLPVHICNAAEESISIPGAPGVESLNLAIAHAIVMYALSVQSSEISLPKH